MELYYDLEEIPPEEPGDTARTTYKIFTPLAHSFNGTRYLGTVLGRFRHLEKLTVRLTMLEDRYNWRESEDPVEECAKEYGDVMDAVMAFYAEYRDKVDVKLLYCSEWFDEEIDLSQFVG